ncbi:ABC transporter substrate-binding protein [Aggregatilinea lenta]|uniref:ABC transporter substrate-binding protein n=1 Tax=Aggregatilinea lenta TaxID=913108 RepID=UPI0013C2C670|nr:ABC transporter substrate-binding protein [Aggregatilinea lenta]
MRERLIAGGRWIWAHWRLAGAALAVLIALAALALYLLTRPGARFGPIDLTWHRIQVNRDLYVGIDPSYPPFAEWTPERIEGIEADIAREIARRLDVEPQILIMGYDGLYDSLYTGYVDFVIAGLSYSASQADWVHYSAPYYDAGQILVTPLDAPLERMSQLDGRTLAVELASAGDIAAQRWQRRLHSLTVSRFMLPDDAMQAVLDGDAEAALVDTVSARLYTQAHPGLRMASQPSVPEEYVIAIRDANYRLIDAVERALADMKADGTLDSIINRWL